MYVSYRYKIFLSSHAMWKMSLRSSHQSLDKNSMTFLSNLNYDWKIVREMCSSCTDSCWSLCLVWAFPRSLPSESILLIQCVLMLFELLTSPDVMCKYNLINPPNNNKHCGNICISSIMIMCGITRNSLFLTSFKPHFPKKNPAKQTLSIFCKCP